MVGKSDSIRSINGHSNWISFKILTAETIDAIEKYVKEDLLELITKNYELSGETLSDADKTHFFGLFAKDTKQFRFFSGEKATLVEMARHVGQNNSGTSNNLLQYEPKKEFKIQMKYMIRLPIGLVYRSSNASMIKVAPNDLKSELTKKIKTIYNQCSVAYDETALATAIQVKNVGNKLVGEVECALCVGSKISSAKKRIQYAPNKDSLRAYWTTSNFKMHLLKHKRVAVDKKETSILNYEQKNVEHIEDDDILIEFVDEINTKNNALENESHILSIDLDTNTIDATNGIGVANANELIENYIDSIYKQIANQNRIMYKAVMEYNEKTVETHYILNGQEKNMNLVRIKGEGSCMFLSLVHQLSPSKINSASHSKDAQKLRKEVVAYSNKSQ